MCYNKRVTKINNSYVARVVYSLYSTPSPLWTVQQIGKLPSGNAFNACLVSTRL
nr:MAG TPA: hypothetical protein [Podoviridae sp. ctkBg18]